MGAGAIGDAHASKDIDGFTQTIGHGVLGGLLGAGTALVTNEDVGLGALSGAGGAIVAEKVAEVLDSEDATPAARLRAR